MYRNPIYLLARPGAACDAVLGPAEWEAAEKDIGDIGMVAMRTPIPASGKSSDLLPQRLKTATLFYKK